LRNGLAAFGNQLSGFPPSEETAIFLHLNYTIEQQLWNRADRFLTIISEDKEGQWTWRLQRQPKEGGLLSYGFNCPPTPCPRS
jgi:hypothetical protein